MLIDDPFNNHSSVAVMPKSPDRQPNASICDAHKESTGPASLQSMKKEKFPNPGPLGICGDGAGHAPSGR